MKFPAMFSPIRIGTVTVPNRFSQVGPAEADAQA